MTKGRLAPLVPAAFAAAAALLPGALSAQTVEAPSPSLRGSIVPEASTLTPASAVRSEIAPVAPLETDLTDEKAVADLPVRLPPPPAEDAYEALGLRMGSFLVFPSVELGVGYSDNLDEAAGGEAGGFGYVAPALSVRSDWSRHALEADVSGSLEVDEEGETVDGPTVDAVLRGRLDLISQTRLDLEAAFRQFREDPIDADLPVALDEDPEAREYRAAATLSKTFNRLTLAATGEISRYELDEGEIDQETFELDDRAYDTYGARLRASYEMSPRFSPFVEAFADERRYDERVNSDGLSRDSTGYGGEAGATFELTGKLEGEAAVGYTFRRLDDPALEDFDGLTGRASLAWTATPLTTLRLAAATEFEESDTVDSPGSITRSLAFEVEHSLRRHLILIGRADVSYEDFVEIDRDETRYGASLDMLYKLSRMVWLTGGVRHERLDSSIPDIDYTANIIRVGLRLQR